MNSLNVTADPAYLSLLQAPIGIAIVITDTQGNFVACNANFCSLIEYDKDELQGLDFQGLTHQDDVEKSRWLLRDLFAGSVSKVVMEKRYFARSGRAVWCRVHASTLSAGDGKEPWVVKVVEDITERRSAEKEVIKSQMLLKMAGRAARLGGWTFDNDSQELLWSEETCAIHDLPDGYRPTLSEGISFYLPEYRSMIDARVSSCLNDGSPFDFEAEVTTARHRRIWVRAIGEAVRDSRHNVIGFQGALQDITLQRNHELERNALAIKLSNTLRDMSDSFFTLDRNWRITYVNDAMTQSARREREELLDQLMWDAFPGSENSPFYRCYEKAMASREAATVVDYYEPLDKWFHVRVFPTEDGIAVYFQDITSMKQVEERLREQAALLDKAQDAIWVLNLDASVEFWNPSAERIYGWSIEDVQRMGARELLFPHAEDFNRCLQVVLEQGEWVGEMAHQDKTGQKLLLVSRWTLVRDAAGQPRSILAINTDVTHQRQLEQQFLRAQRMESIGTLAGGIAHDLNNVLAPILMSIELLKDVVPHQDDQALLRTIEMSARRGADMVKQVLSFARGVEGQRHQVDFSNVLRDLEHILSETIPKNISIVSNLAPDLWQVQADPTQLQQVLLNLCVNARDAMPNGGIISITANNMEVDQHYAAMNIEAREGTYLNIEVEDTGSGIAPETLERIFDPFFTTKPVGEGTGLGLATTLAIVKSHGGYIRAYSELDKGTRFRIYLPADPTAKGQQSVAAIPAVPRGNGELILVVDDELAILHVTRQTLEAYGYRVIVASNGAEAVALYAQNMQAVELVLTDMTMPIMDGPATILALQKINPKVKIIGASGIYQNGKVAKAVGSGVKHFLPKPYTAEVMLRTIATVLE